MKRELTHGSLFSGVEGFGLGAAIAGIKTEWSCEFEKYQTKVIKKKILEMYSSAGSEMYSQFKKEPRPLKSYLGRHARIYGHIMEVVGYVKGSGAWLTVDGSKSGGWTETDPEDVIFKERNGYWYACINDLID